MLRTKLLYHADIVKIFTGCHCILSRKIHILSITEDSSGQSARTKRQTGQSRGGIVVLVAAEKLIGDMMTKERLATYIRDNKDRVESILGGKHPIMQCGLASLTLRAQESDKCIYN